MPAQTGFADGVMVILTGNDVLTVIVTVFEVAGLPLGQVAFEVKTQVTASRFNGIYEKVELFVPVFIPLTFHW